MTEQINEARILFQQNNLEQSLAILDRCIQRNSLDYQAILLRGKIKYKQQKWGEAMNDFASVLEIEPENPEAKSGFQMAKNILGYFTPDLFNP